MRFGLMTFAKLAVRSPSFSRRVEGWVSGRFLERR